MELQKGTAAYKAWQAGMSAYAQGRMIEDCPYTNAKTIALKNWYEKGYNELKQQMGK